MYTRYLAGVGAIAAATLLAGCDIHETTYVYDHPRHRPDVVVVDRGPYPPPPPPVIVAEPAPPPPVVVVQRPPPPPPQVVIVREHPRDAVVVVREVPPAPIRETVTVQPGRDFVWVSGYWARTRDRWVWVGGHWEAPPRRGARYVPPHWEPHGSEFRFSVGVWQ